MLHLIAQPSRLTFRFPFRIAHGVRTGTDVVFVTVEGNGFIGRGEATLPPYLPDTIDSVMAFLAKPEVYQIPEDMHPEAWMKHLIGQGHTCMPGLAALDMALWQWFAAVSDVSLPDALGTEERPTPHTYTLGLSDREEMKQKFDFGRENGFELFKLKLDGQNDAQVIEDYLSISNFPFAVDANQGWSDLDRAISFCQELEKAGCVLVEQPFHKTDRSMSKALRETLSIPLIADEAVQTIADLPSIAESFDGINIKLQKCGGLTTGLEMVREARTLGMKVLIGCMSESSIGCGAAEALAGECDWADLDGPFLILPIE